MLIDEHKEEVKEAVNRVIDSGQFILGEELQAFEEEFADYLGAKWAVGVGSGTDALTLSLKAMDIGPGDEVIVPALTFIATAEAVVNVGATPVFVDVDPGTWNLSAETVAPHLTDETKAIIAVHLFGNPAPIHELNGFELPILEDACQAIGTSLDGEAAGTMGVAGCFSFYPSKTLGGIGDGGMVITNDFDVADEVLLLRHHGSRDGRIHLLPGTTSRLDEIQAATLRVLLPYVDEEIERRQWLAAYVGDQAPLQEVIEGGVHSYHQIIGILSETERVRVMDEEPELRNFYRIPLHKQPSLARYYKSALPVSESFGRSNVAFPTDDSYWMTNNEVNA